MGDDERKLYSKVTCWGHPVNGDVWIYTSLADSRDHAFT